MESVSGNIFIRRIWLPHAGDEIPPHRHNYEHTAFGSRGEALVRLEHPDGRIEERRLWPGDHCLVPGEAFHSVRAMTPDTLVLCVYSHRTAQGEVSVEDTGWSPAYR